MYHFLLKDFLSDGNGIRLTIITDSIAINTMTSPGFMRSSSKEIIDRMTPAAVMGIPTNPLEGADRLNLAKRSAPQIKRILKLQVQSSEHLLTYTIR